MNAKIKNWKIDKQCELAVVTILLKKIEFIKPCWIMNVERNVLNSIRERIEKEVKGEVTNAEMCKGHIIETNFRNELTG